jgi:hypothetical protein
MKEKSDRAGLLIYYIKHQGLPNAVFMTRLEHVLMEKSVCGPAGFGALGAVLIAVSLSGDARTGMTDPTIG